MRDADSSLDDAEACFRSPVSVVVLFAVPRSKSSELVTPVGDGDNFEKAIYDLIQSKGYLEDDRLITTCTWRKRFLPYGTDGYTEITINLEEESIDIT